MNNPISVRDAASMLRHPIKKNMKPYDFEVSKLNNRMVDEWEDKILRKIASDNGTVPCRVVWPSWQLYRDGLWIKNYMESLENTPSLSDEQLEYWKQFFENLEIEELHENGILAINNGWYFLNKVIQDHFIRQRWDKIFSQSNDPYEWFKLSEKHKELIQGTKLPFWDQEYLKEVSEKIEAILRIQVRPTK